MFTFKGDAVYSSVAFKGKSKAFIRSRAIVASLLSVGSEMSSRLLPYAKSSSVICTSLMGGNSIPSEDSSDARCTAGVQKKRE